MCVHVWVCGRVTSNSDVSLCTFDDVGYLQVCIEVFL